MIGNRFSFCALAQNTADLPAIQLGHHDIQQDRIRCLALYRVYGFLPVARDHCFIVLFLEMIAEKFGTVMFIINNKNLFFHKALVPTFA